MKFDSTEFKGASVFAEAVKDETGKDFDINVSFTGTLVDAAVVIYNAMKGSKDFYFIIATAMEYYKQQRVEQIIVWVKKHFRNELTEEENKQFQDWLSESEANREFFNQFDDEDKMIDELKHYHNIDTADMWKRTMAQMNNDNGNAYSPHL